MQAGTDHIADFTTTAAGGAAGHDINDLTGWNTTFAAVQGTLAFNVAAGHAIFTVTSAGNTETIHLDNITSAALTATLQASDFKFA